MTAVRQSDLKTWAKCPLILKYEQVDGIPREQGGSAVFGTVVHDVVLWMETREDLPGALARFDAMWRDPIGWLGQDKGQIDYYENGRSWKKFAEKGPAILRNWWSIIRWDADVVLGRELFFADIPIGQDGNTLTGTIDKLAMRFVPKINSWVVLVSDYKTAAKAPTYEYLEDDLQFTHYLYSTTQPQFWTHVPNGEVIRQRVAGLPRMGEWVQLQGPKRMECGVREQHHYNRLAVAVDAYAASRALGVFVPNISGATCRFCEHRKHCGLPPVEAQL